MARVASAIPLCLNGHVPDYMGFTLAANIPTAVVEAAPATWTPVGSISPGNLADMNAISTASGDDLNQGLTWASPNYFLLGNGDSCHWNGTAWVDGVAP